MNTFDAILQAGMVLSGSIFFTLMSFEVYCAIRADHRRQRSRRTAARKGGR